MTDRLAVTERTRLRRKHTRGEFNRDAIYAILDAMPLCHVGTIMDGAPVVIPTFQWREGNHVYWHGSRASRGVRAAEVAEVCLTVSILDGLVLARSGMHHSASYRSAMIFGRPSLVSDPDAKVDKLKAFIERLYPGRWDTLRPITESEANATSVLSLPIEEASAKVRTGGPVDDEEDYALPIWCGVIPVTLQTLEPDPDPRNLEGVPEPAHARSVNLG